MRRTSPLCGLAQAFSPPHLLPLSRHSVQYSYNIFTLCIDTHHLLSRSFALRFLSCLRDCLGAFTFSSVAPHFSSFSFPCRECSVLDRHLPGLGTSFAPRHTVHYPCEASCVSGSTWMLAWDTSFSRSVCFLALCGPSLVSDGHVAVSLLWHTAAVSLWRP